MGESEHVIDALTETGVLASIRWAHRSAYRQLWQDYNPDGGHDQAWIGFTAHKYLVNRQDRVFQCKGYAAPEGQEGAGRDVLAAGIHQQDFLDMPSLRPGVVVRRDLNSSPGWMAGEWRWLLMSCEFGRVDDIVWSQRSETKDMVARQPYLDDEIGLFRLAELLPPESALTEDQRVLRKTLILTHAMDPETGEAQLFLGRSRSNEDHGPAWAWRTDLLALPDMASGIATAPVAQPAAETHADDAAVRIRRSVRDDAPPRAIGDA